MYHSFNYQQVVIISWSLEKQTRTVLYSVFPHACESLSSREKREYHRVPNTLRAALSEVQCSLLLIGPGTWTHRITPRGALFSTLNPVHFVREVENAGNRQIKIQRTDCTR